MNIIKILDKRSREHGSYVGMQNIFESIFPYKLDMQNIFHHINQASVNIAIAKYIFTRKYIWSSCSLEPFILKIQIRHFEVTKNSDKIMFL
jgi:hypothetical protein